jgi:hypothetical protein
MIHVVLQQSEYSGINIYSALAGFLHKIVTSVNGYVQDEVIFACATKP